VTQKDIEYRLCEENFMFFVGFVFANLYKRAFVWYDFHKKLAGILLDLPNLLRVIINAPPRIGKTDLTKLYIAWLFLKDPSSTVIYCSYDEALVARKNREIKEILVWLSKYFDIPELKPLTQANGKKEWVNRAGGMILARGTNSNVTGSGCKTLLVLDDPNKPADRISQTILARRWQVFKSTIRNRIDLPTVPILVIQQRVAAQDLTGYLLQDKEEHWRHFKFSAIDEKGESICPERLPVSEIDKYKSDPFTYNAQYLQVPLDDIGKMFKKDQLIFTNTRPPMQQLRLVIAVDAAGGKNDIGNDFNAIAVCAREMNGPNYYVLDVYNFRADITVLVQKIKEVRKRWGSNTPVLIESKSNGMAAIQLLRREMSGILEISPCKDKVERALVIKYLFDAKNVTFSTRGLIWGDILTQFTQFPHTAHDDIVDAVVHGITWLMKLPTFKQNSTIKDADFGRPNYGRPTYARNGYSN
jgi:predicted phage terminase large subunit-like protein